MLFGSQLLGRLTLKGDLNLSTDKSNQYIPIDVSEFSDTALMITWGDGHESIYLFEDLREQCPCATCRQLRKNSKSGKQSLKKTIPLRAKAAPIRPLKMEPVGRYAFKFTWNDKHDTGIYTFEFLRNMCTCEQCLPEGS